MRDHVRFLRGLDAAEVTARPGPTDMLLDWLRGQGQTGTKEGCNEGDCGACTVVVGRDGPDGPRYEPANACILTMGQLDGAHLITIEDLRDHPIQRAMVGRHASQCGFCTPGFVMALVAGAERGLKTRRDAIEAVSGNLCRCTGYRPILDAALDAPAPLDLIDVAGFDDGQDVFIGDDARFFAAPASEEALCRLAALHPDATILAGGTDVGLWVTKRLDTLPKVIWLGRSGLDRVERAEDAVTLGAAVTYSGAEAALTFHPDVSDLWWRIGGRQVRGTGTVAGNIANGSPIGDTPPLLIALGATLRLRHGDAVRDLPLEAFHLAYGRQDRAPGEVLTHVTVPRPTGILRCHKLSKRVEQDISAVMMAFQVWLEDGRIARIRLAFGGMAATPKRAPAAEAWLTGRAPDDTEGLEAALAEDFSPISDMRASAAYRALAAARLVQRSLADLSPAMAAE